MSTPFTLGIALEGAGWHPAAWREPSSQPTALFTPAYWADRVREAETAGADYVTIEDSLALQTASPHESDDRTDLVRGRLDALLIASRVAPVTERIGLIPVVTTTHTEPFHVSTGIATLDFVSGGRAGWQAKVSINPVEAGHFGRREWPEFTIDAADPALQTLLDDLLEEAADAVEVARRLWDSWEDDAEIRDVATDRFLDADKLHEIDFEGRFFSVRGPSITPRSPQGQPVVAALAHSRVPYEFAARSADLVFTTPLDRDAETRILSELDVAARTVGRTGEPPRAIADLVVFLDAPGESGARRRDRLDALGTRGEPFASDARIVAGSAGEVADVIGGLAQAGYAGARLRPGVLTDDVPRIGAELVPELRRRGLLREPAEAKAAPSLRARLGLEPHAANRYARPTATRSNA